VVTTPSPSDIVVGSFNFPESAILAELYGQAIRHAGFPVRIQPNLGTRELVEPALAQGFVTMVPEYAGSALDFVSLGSTAPSPDPSVTRQALASALASWGAEPLAAAPAQDANAIVVTPATAKEYGLRTISDLAPVASRLVFGGPPECAQRPLCLKGLEDRYGLTFERFQPLDSGGLTLQELETGQIDVALLFTTDPHLRNLVVLRDDRRLQPAENVIPVVRREVLARFGPQLAVVVDRVSARITTPELQALVGRVVISGQTPAAVAAQWLAGQGW
jgi:osmoprotectant transport system substrate-binding protein